MKFITYIFLTILSLIIFSCKTNKNVRFYRDLSAEIITKTDNNRKVIQKNDITKVISKDSFSVKILRIKEDFTFNNFSLDTVHDFFNNSKVLGYVTQEHKKQLYKVVSNVYQDRKSANEALSKMPAIVKENKPYLENVENVKNLYKNYN